MKIIGINGSPRTHSNSELLLDFVLRELGEQHETSKVNLRAKKVDCAGCRDCLKDIHVHDDDMASIYEEVLQSDVLVLSTPVQYGMPSAIMKVFMDRTDPFWHKKQFAGKLGATIVNGASQFEGIELCSKNMQHFFYSHDMTPVPHAACITNSLAYPDNKLPIPLPSGLTAPLKALAEDIEKMSVLLESKSA